MFNYLQVTLLLHTLTKGKSSDLKSYFSPNSSSSRKKLRFEMILFISPSLIFYGECNLLAKCVSSSALGFDKHFDMTYPHLSLV